MPTKIVPTALMFKQQLALLLFGYACVIAAAQRYWPDYFFQYVITLFDYVVF